MEKVKYKDNRVKVRHFPISVFISSFAMLAILTTVHNKILGKYINFYAIPPSYYVIMNAYWIFVAAIFTFLNRWQVVRSYDRPLQQFARATKKVANGDFPVFVRPIHTSDKADYLDVMIEDFNKMVAELGSIETLKTDFFSNVSHEIKTPLALIQNYAELLQNPTLSEELRQEYVESIFQSTRRLSELITNILKLSKLEKQKIHLVTDEYDLCSQLCECTLQFETVWEQKNIDLIADIEDRAIIHADESLMELVWNNLLSNAMKFTASGGSVTLRQTSTEEEILVQVIDTGCGINEENLSRIFDKFYQGDASHSTEGNGLGLAIVLRVLQMLGYTISVESTLGKGTTFTVRIPIMEGKEQCYE